MSGQLLAWSQQIPCVIRATTGSGTDAASRQKHACHRPRGHTQKPPRPAGARAQPLLTWGSENSSPVTLCVTTAAFPGMFLARTGTSRSIACRTEEDTGGWGCRSGSGRGASSWAASPVNGAPGSSRTGQLDKTISLLKLGFHMMHWILITYRICQVLENDPL